MGRMERLFQMVMSISFMHRWEVWHSLGAAHTQRVHSQMCPESSHLQVSGRGLLGEAPPAAVTSADMTQCLSYENLPWNIEVFYRILRGYSLRVWSLLTISKIVNYAPCKFAI
jgi:hypothetical protein